MKPERWQQVEELFRAALERGAGERAGFLAQACAGDEEARREVESLLAAHVKAEGFIETPAFEIAAAALADEQSRLLVGQSLGHYRILEWLGEGGMGEVYLAEDIMLGRRVALKLLPADFTTDAERLRRFKQEARTASALNHPNIITIHEIAQYDGAYFMATEFIDGMTLRQKLSGGQLKLKEALDVAYQIVLALTAAHETKIIHRDIKPENIMLRGDGIVKVLDFGLAKLTKTKATALDSEAPTEVLALTEPGKVMGTVAYMSPEQVRGLTVDARTDIWSLGVVLYEMVTGHVPFEGSTTSDVIVSVLEREPLSLTRQGLDVPAELQRIVARALHKDREERYQLVKDMLLDLKRLRQELDFEAQRKDKNERSQTGQETVADPRVLKHASGFKSHTLTKENRGVLTAHRVVQTLNERLTEWRWPSRFAHRRLVGWLVVLAFVSLIVAGAFTFMWRSPSPRIVRTVQLTNDGRDKDFFQLATDGSRVYFSEDLGQTAEFAQVPTTGGEATQIPASFLGGPGQGVLFDVSPGRNELLVGSARVGEEPALWAMSVLGGPGRRLGDLRGHSACWSPDTQRVAYASGRDLYIAKSDGTESRKLVTPSVDGVPLFPSWSPDGSRLRFNMFDGAKNTAFLWEEAVDGTDLHPLLPGWKSSQWGGRWTPDGRYYIFLVGYFHAGGYTSDFWAIRETKSFFGKVDREPIQLTFGPLGFFPPVFSPDGKRLFTMGYLQHGELMRYDVPTEHWVPFLSGMSEADVDFSRDGKWVTYVTYPDGPLWRSRADGSQRVQLTSPEIRIRLPRWSPDGKQIAFSGQVSGQPFQIYVISAEGGKAEQLVQRDCVDFDPTWSPDGNRLAFAPAPGTSCKAAIYLLDLKSRQVSQIAGSDGLYSPRWSPDGKSIVALTPDDSRLMLFSFATQRWEEAVTGLASCPGWSRDGRFVYFMNDSDVLRVRIADHKVERMASLTGVRLQMGSVLGLTPDGSPLVLRETTAVELYALDLVAP